MGSQASKLNEQDKSVDNKFEKNSHEDSYILIKENTSSYQGVKTETSESTGRKSISAGSTTSDKAEDVSDAFQEIKFPVTFEWKEGGNLVYLTGSFCGWNQFFIMTKNPDNGEFQCVINLIPGIYQYKFKVDGQWRFSTLFKTVNDHGNINNEIDTTKQKPPEKESQKKQKHNNKNYKKEENTGYGFSFPKVNDLNTDAFQVPKHYLNNFNLDYNTHQHLLGNKKYFNRIEQNLLSENNSFKDIAKPTHVNLNHMHSKILEDDVTNSILISCTSRVRNKFSTVVYYGPSNNSIN